MGSVELVDLINVVRKEENPENSALRHDHFMAKVAKVLGEEAAPKFRGSYTGEDNKAYHRDAWIEAYALDIEV